jgi:signal transduction histidine kinase
LENLIKNGIDAMKGKGLIRISVSEFTPYIEILIQDSGSGMKKETLSKIFKPGFTTKIRGWGLGLSLAKRIVEDFHLGKISVQKTAPGQGTTFQLILNKELEK